MKPLKNPDRDLIVTFEDFIKIVKKHFRYFKKHVMKGEVEFIYSSEDSEIDNSLKMPVKIP